MTVSDSQMKKDLKDCGRYSSCCFPVQFRRRIRCQYRHGHQQIHPADGARCLARGGKRRICLLQELDKILNRTQITVRWRIVQRKERQLTVSTDENNKPRIAQTTPIGIANPEAGGHQGTSLFRICMRMSLFFLFLISVCHSAIRMHNALESYGG